MASNLLNWAPFQILVGPVDVYLAPRGEAFPAVNVTPAGNWVDIGQTEGGVTLRATQTVTPITTDQSPAPVKQIRNEEGVEVEFAFAELTLENFSLALNANTVTATTSGSAAIKEVQFERGVRVDLRALLLRGRSPYGSGPAQYEVPAAANTDASEIAHVRDDKSVLSTTWTAQMDLTKAVGQRFGRFIATTQTT